MAINYNDLMYLKNQLKTLSLYNLLGTPNSLKKIIQLENQVSDLIIKSL